MIERMCELLEPPVTAKPTALLDDVRAASRAETRAAAQRLTGIWHVYKVRLRENGDHAEWAVDTWDAVAAALNITLMLAGSYVRLAKAMHERLPLLGMVFAAGDVDYRAFQTMVYRADLIIDAEVAFVRRSGRHFRCNHRIGSQSTRRCSTNGIWCRLRDWCRCWNWLSRPGFRS
jgi:Domain of unknown function (DUF222)